jgi:hypothetical protein
MSFVRIAVATDNSPRQRLADALGNVYAKLDTKLDDLCAELDTKLDTKLDDLYAKLGAKLQPLVVLVALQLEDWRSEVETRGSVGKAFKGTLKGYFANPDIQTTTSTMLRCMVTNLLLPADCVMAAHIVPWRKHHFARALLDMHDINAGCNGLLWCWPLEQAWTDHKFAIRYSGDPRCNPLIHMHVVTCECCL